MAILVNGQPLFWPVALLVSAGALLALVLGWSVIGFFFSGGAHVAGVIALFLAAVAAAAALIVTGAVFAAVWQFVVAVGLVVCALSVLGVIVLRVRAATGNAPDWVPMIALVLALPATLVGLLQLVTPTGALLPGSTDCSSTAVYGSSLLVRVKSAGQNARTGPATTYPIANRFDVGCILGIDGYCIGEPVDDSIVGLADVRWFRLRYTRSYVSSGSVDEVGPDTAATRKAGLCTGFDSQRIGLVGPTAVEPDKSHTDLALLKSHPVGTPLVGYAVYSPAVGQSSIGALGSAPKSTADDGLAYARLSVSHNQPTKQRNELVLAISACAAAGVPAGRPQIYELNLDRRKGMSAHYQVSSALSRRLSLAACRIDPSVSNGNLKRDSVSVPW